MIRRPPRSTRTDTLFPSTTLFRSEIVEEEALLYRGLALADEMLATSPYGLRLSKQALNLNIDAPSLEAAMAIEDRQQVILSATEDHREALAAFRSEEHTSELQSLMRISYAVFCLNKKIETTKTPMMTSPKK